MNGRLPKKLVSVLLSMALFISIFSMSGVSYAYSNAFEYDAQTAFDSISEDKSWDLGKVRNPPDPNTTSWQAKYGTDTVRWKDANQVQMFFDGCYGTTSAFVWELQNGFMLPTGSGSDIVAVAQSQANLPEYQRIETPDGSNHVGYVDWYLGSSPGDYSPWNWCCIFVMFCATSLGPEYAERGENSLFAWTASCTYQYNYMMRRGYPSFSVSNAWANREQVMPGDLVFFKDYKNGGWGHIGIVEEVGSNNSYIQTIEGNTSGSFNPITSESKTEGVHRQRYTSTSSYPGLQGGMIVRPPYPASTVPEGGES